MATPMYSFVAFGDKGKKRSENEMVQIHSLVILNDKAVILFSLFNAISNWFHFFKLV